MTAAISMDYQDAVLVCLMWHAFGWASEMSLVRKQDPSVSTNNVEHVQQPQRKSLNKKMVAYKALLVTRAIFSDLSPINYKTHIAHSRRHRKYLPLQLSI